MTASQHMPSSDPSRARRQSPPKKIHPSALAYSLLNRAKHLLATKRKYAQIGVPLPAQDIVSTGNVDDVVAKMTKDAHRYSLRVLYVSDDGQVWVQEL